MRVVLVGVLAASAGLAACTTTQQNAAADFRPPAGDYKLIVMRPDVQVSVLTAGGQLEPREDWTNEARANVLAALQAQQVKRGGHATIAATDQDAGANSAMVAQLDRLHEVVGRSIQLHKYTPDQGLPTKKGVFDWTLGQLAVDYGQQSGYDYALFLYARDSFSSAGRMALQAMGALTCAVGVCLMPGGGYQIAFASLVDLKTGNVVWYNYLVSSVGDIREPEGAQGLVDDLLDDMKPGKAANKG